MRTLGLKLDEDVAKVRLVEHKFKADAFDESAADMVVFSRARAMQTSFGKSFAVWLMKTREMAEKGELTEGQMDKLAIIGVDCAPISAAVEKFIGNVRLRIGKGSEFAESKQHQNLDEDQKEAYREGKLSEAQIKRLEALDPIVFLDFSTNSSSSINAR